MKRKKWREDFSSWFNETLRKGEIMDTRYPVKGLYVWLPNGLELRNRMLKIIRSLLKKTGHEEVLFPLLIPRNIFSKEAEHIKGFEDEVYWVTHGGLDKLNVDLALRPTSETSIYPMLKLWIRSHRDLPLKLFQVVNVFRHETKATKPLIRLREVTTFKEAHTAHKNAESAEKQVEEGIETYRKFFDEVGVPYIITRRPPWDTFAGAEYSIGFDTLAPDGRTLQIGTVHNLGQNFSKVYDITFENLDGDQEHAHQTCYGISDRVVAAVMMTHGDDQGMCLPPNVAPIQTVIVPIPYKDEEVNIKENSEKIEEELKKANVRVHLDTRDLRPGDKYYRWERRGVPLRIEIGPREIEENKATLVRRDTGERIEISSDTLASEVEKAFKNIAHNLKERARKYMEDRIYWVEDEEKAKEIIEEGKGIARIPWCGKESCGLEIETQTGANVLGRGFNGESKERNCPICGEITDESAFVAKTY